MSSDRNDRQLYSVDCIQEREAYYMVTMKIRLGTIEIRAAYALGKRQFPGIQLPEADLRGLDLRGVDLSGANLAGADLRESNLERVNLQSANLQGANLGGANLKNSSLQEANLKQADLMRADLREADLTRADLEKACCKNANLARSILDRANLHGSILNDARVEKSRLDSANLCETWLLGTDLNKATLAGAFYNDRTRFNADFNPTTARMILVDCITIEDIVSILSSIYQFGCKYLGKTIAGKYWESTCPRSILLERFPVTPSDEITFAGDRTIPLDNLQLWECRQWMDRFVHSCNSIVLDFIERLKQQAENPRIDRFLDF